MIKAYYRKQRKELIEKSIEKQRELKNDKNNHRKQRKEVIERSIKRIKESEREKEKKRY